MLTPHEIFARMPAAVGSQILAHVQENEAALYQATIHTLAKQRNLRLVFIERKPRAERYAWLQATIGRAQNDSIAMHLLQIWLVGAQTKLLCDFLDALGIAHDENGTIETLPSAPPKADLAKAVDTLCATHDPGVVAVYLHTFQTMDDQGWSTLEELLAEDARLQLAKKE
jgi:hypothetical protein